jgi:hypothetical protein
MMMMTMQPGHGSRLRDPRLAWAAIQDAVRDGGHDELADIAISLYGQLGEARAEIARLRASLHASLAAPAPAGPLRAATPNRRPS